MTVVEQAEAAFPVGGYTVCCVGGEQQLIAFGGWVSGEAKQPAGKRPQTAPAGRPAPVRPSDTVHTFDMAEGRWTRRDKGSLLCSCCTRCCPTCP